jgi:hypothetical protein
MTAMQNNNRQDHASKNVWLWLVLTATVSASIWVSLHEETPDEPAVRPARKTAKAQMNPLELTGASSQKSNDFSAPRPLIKSEPGPLFGDPVRDETASLKDEPATAPEAPPLPFTYAGKLIEDGKYTVFLLAGGQSFAVHAGDVIESVWRLKAFNPPKIIFVYMPLKLEVAMDIGESN